MQKVIYLVLAISLITGGCSSSRKGSKSNYTGTDKPGSGNSLAAVIDNNLSSNDFFIQRADVRLSTGVISVRFNAAIRFKKPDSLLISLKSKTGLEAGRAFITRDTLIINDRINKKILVGDAKSIRSKYGIEPAYIYAVLGDLILDDNERTGDLNCKKGTQLSTLAVKEHKIEYTIDCNRKKAIKTYFEGELRSGNIQILYKDFTNVGNAIVPQVIEISEDLENINILIEIKKVEVPWHGSINFSPGAGYKIVRIK